MKQGNEIITDNRDIISISTSLNVLEYKICSIENSLSEKEARNIRKMFMGAQNESKPAKPKSIFDLEIHQPSYPNTKVPEIKPQEKQSKIFQSEVEKNVQSNFKVNALPGAKPTADKPKELGTLSQILDNVDISAFDEPKPENKDLVRKTKTFKGDGEEEKKDEMRLNNMMVNDSFDFQ